LLSDYKAGQAASNRAAARMPADCIPVSGIYNSRPFEALPCGTASLAPSRKAARMPHRFSGLTIAIVLVATVPVLAQDEDSYNERLEYDVATGTWVEIPPPVPGTDAGDLAIARALLAKNEYGDARDAFDDWFDTYAESSLRDEALFYAAETEIAAEDADPKSGDLIQAHEWLLEVIEAWPGSDISDRALRRQLIIAEMFLFKDRKQRLLKGTIWLTAEEEALKILSKITDEWANGKPIAEQALRLKGDYHYQNGEFEEAELTYARLMREFPRGRYRKISLLRSGQSALARFPGVEFDDADLLEADVYFRDFQSQYATEAEAYRVPQTLQRIQDSLAHKEFTVASFYERTRRLDSAAYYYRYIIDAWPESTWAAQSRERLVAIGATGPTTVDVDANGNRLPPADIDKTITSDDTRTNESMNVTANSVADANAGDDDEATPTTSASGQSPARTSPPTTPTVTANGQPANSESPRSTRVVGTMDPVD